ncbi:uncharacterized protein KNAG_0J01950 [Huiozyma naganishii CBS 8797]|uniref:non-specific serine/threonine protein kinase n=1 Tax=Huiozyma naganishii (strain ATCC MYA-139 / BCRC 22969 / CBS 8797 / KCTC 17520 / NBRC 10181 / NCYC 3082 / Yp74L-3) TaxID=1071383 RepID=J7SAL4_HUIN7|nr:hypothetical protein KNAG_0J01950 [Kazachstania naganishii CBS 8797]CCK72276.1 hypothetical protein KNAG_0J01950 [Kazachstania naganishii CBS 8797]
MPLFSTKRFHIPTHKSVETGGDAEGDAREGDGPQPGQINHAGTSSRFGDLLSPHISNSMMDLKRFLRPGAAATATPTPTTTTTTTTTTTMTVPGGTAARHGRRHTSSELQDETVAEADTKASTPRASTPRASTPTRSISSAEMNDDSLLESKYGQVGQIIGSGAGGSVKLIKRPSDGRVFAVKEFRARKDGETLSEYGKKCTTEFIVGSSLHHANVVETLDIFSNGPKDKYFEVMEYLPVDFFGVVMSGVMSRGEIHCYFKQLLLGVEYLHSMGIAHRDLKLDNCVMTEQGILKIIDFGSAVIFKYPYTPGITLARGIVGSDPYLAPEIVKHPSHKYDPQLVDVWSAGVIYCCMVLQKFPWRAPRSSDRNFRLYDMPDDEPHDYEQSARDHVKMKAGPAQEPESKDTEATPQPLPHHHHAKHGPYRLMRLLPHAARPLLSRMLQVDPTTRASVHDVTADDWFSSLPACTEVATSAAEHTTVRAPGHHHTIVRDGQPPLRV